jgi:hypothetical protein
MLRSYSLAFLFFLFVSSTANAAFVWKSGTQSFSSAASACAAAVSSAGYGTGAVVTTVTNYESYSTATCTGTSGTRSDGEPFDLTYAGITVAGSGNCDSGTTYNSKTGSCDQPTQADGDLCTDQSGAQAASSTSIAIPMIYDSSIGGCVKYPNAAAPAMCKYMASIDNGSSPATYSVDGTSNDIGLGVAPPTFVTDAGGCEYKTILTSSCKVSADGTSKCVVTARLTGNVGTVASGDSTKSSLCTSPSGCSVDTTPQTTYTDSGCSDKGNCTQETKSDTSGSQSCITSGSLVCNNTKPKSTDTTTVTSTTSKSNADDSVSSTVTADTTTKSCTDLNTCTTKASTTQTTTTTSKTGGTSTSSTCTGSCNSDGTAAEDDTDDDDGGSATASNTCKTPPACSGDPFQCAILNQQWIDSCALRALPTADESAAFDAKIQAQKDSLDANQKTLDDGVSSLVSSFESSATSSAGGKCFEDKTIPVNGISFTLPFSQVCPYLEWFRYAVLAVAYLISLRIVTKEL